MQFGIRFFFALLISDTRLKSLALLNEVNMDDIGYIIKKFTLVLFKVNIGTFTTKPFVIPDVDKI